MKIEILEHFPGEEEAPQQLQGLDRYEIPSLYSALFGRPQLDDFIIKKIASAAATPSEVHRLLVNLPINTIVTTNWDTLLEKASDDSDIRASNISNDNNIYRMGKQIKNIIHLHGSVVVDYSMVVTTNDYESYGNTRPLLSSLARVLMTTNTVLIIGFGLRDRNYSLINNWAKSFTGTTVHRSYAILINNPTYWVQYCAKKGIEPVELKTEVEESKDSRLERFLEDLIERLTTEGGRT